MQLSQSQSSLKQLQHQFSQEREHLRMQLDELQTEHQRRQQRLQEVHCCSMQDMEHARQRALSSAWAREQQRVRDGEEGVRLWTEGEKRQLLSSGKVLGYDGYYVLSIEQYPELADSANNIQFLRQSEIGRR